jgi:hypothetical protein
MFNINEFSAINEAIYSSGLTTRRLKDVEVFIGLEFPLAPGSSSVCRWEAIISTNLGWEEELEDLKVIWSKYDVSSCPTEPEITTKQVEYFTSILEKFILLYVKLIVLSSANDFLECSANDFLESIGEKLFRYNKPTESVKSHGGEKQSSDVIVIGPSHLCLGKVIPALHPNVTVLGSGPVMRIDNLNGNNDLSKHLNSQWQKIGDEFTFDVLGYAGCPVFHKLTFELLRKASEETQNVVWMVPDFRINNVDITALRDLQRTADLRQEHNTNCDLGEDIFINSRFSMIDRALLSHENDSFLVTYGQKCIDLLLAKFPGIKLVFWCAFKRYAHANLSQQNSDIKQNKQTSGVDGSVYSASNTSIYKDLYPKLVEKYKDNVIDIRGYVTSIEDFDRNMTIDSGGHPSATGYAILQTMILDNVFAND